MCNENFSIRLREIQFYILVRRKEKKKQGEQEEIEMSELKLQKDVRSGKRMIILNHFRFCSHVMMTKM